MRIEREILMPVSRGILLEGSLAVPRGASGVVVFAHGSGSSRHSPRNRFVAERLQRAKLGTLLMDLLTSDEEREERFTGAMRFDIELLSGRLIAATSWLHLQPATGDLRIGMFGASTGAAAALVAAARSPELVDAVVSRGGRPDLAGAELTAVQAPVLLIVGGADNAVLRMNREALRRLPGEKTLEIVPDATHLFEEPGALEQVAALASGWFQTHLVEIWRPTVGGGPAHP